MKISQGNMAFASSLLTFLEKLLPHVGNELARKLEIERIRIKQEIFDQLLRIIRKVSVLKHFSKNIYEYTQLLELVHAPSEELHNELVNILNLMKTNKSNRDFAANFLLFLEKVAPHADKEFKHWLSAELIRLRKEVFDATFYAVPRPLEPVYIRIPFREVPNNLPRVGMGSAK